MTKRIEELLEKQLLNGEELAELLDDVEVTNWDLVGNSGKHNGSNWYSVTVGAEEYDIYEIKEEDEETSLTFLLERYDLDYDSERFHFHKAVDELYDTFYTNDVDDEEKIIKEYLSSETWGNQKDYMRILEGKNIRYPILNESESIDGEEYDKERAVLHKLISDRDVQELKEFDSKYYRLNIY